MDSNVRSWRRSGRKRRVFFFFFQGEVKEEEEEEEEEEDGEEDCFRTSKLPSCSCNSRRSLGGCIYPA